MFKGLMAGISGVRGVVGEGMTPEVALLWSGAFATWVNGVKVVVGRDSRPTGEMLNRAVLAGLTAAGCDVDDVGIIPTPVAALAVERRGAGGGIIITASHNPQEWNALKFVRADGRMIAAADFAELSAIVSEGPLRSAPWDLLGRVNLWDGAEVMYISAVSGLKAIDLAKIERKHYRVAIDCVNGAGCVTYPRLLEALGCVVKTLNTAPTGIFPRGPEPTPEHTHDLAALVVKEKCDLGFAVDPDGDRLAVIDSNGNPLGEELTLALAMRGALDAAPGPVVVNSLTSQVIDDLAQQYGVPCHRAKVGEANVAAAMKELHATVGGEGNGGVIYPELHLVRDAGVGMALLLNLMATSRKTLGVWRDTLPTYHMVKFSYSLDKRDPNAILEALARDYEYDQVSRIDGLRVVTSAGWVQVRASNTEPILRIYSESQDALLAKSLANEMMARLDAIAAKALSEE